MHRGLTKGKRSRRGGVLIATLAFFPRGLIGFAKPLSQGVRRMLGRAPQSTP